MNSRADKFRSQISRAFCLALLSGLCTLAPAAAEPQTPVLAMRFFSMASWDSSI